MRLALIIDDYLPQSTRVGAKMFHDLAKQLVESGHYVTVITPDDRIEKILEITDFDGVEVWRFRAGKIKDVGKVKRAINETLLSFLAWKAIRGQISKNTFDGVVYYSPSIFFGDLVRKIKKRCKCPSYLVLRDFFPQWAIDAGMIKQGSLIEKYFRYFERRSYDSADMIGVMSEKNKELFERYHGKDFPVEILRNWACLSPYNSLRKNEIRENLNIKNKIVYFYGGNIGHAQDMANLMRLAKNMHQYKDAHFLFVGQGDEVDLILNMAKEWKLDNFSYLPSVNQSEFKDILSSIDIGLFSLSSKHTSHNFPGKLLGYMVQAIPILGSVNYGNDLLDLVNDNSAGYITINGEDEALLANAVSLYYNADLRRNIGSCGYKLLCAEFSVESAEKSIVSTLEINHERV
ncbi:glycosyltransferase family 4 protein [Vibrio furnissii]|uniref:glycosyltransferase family 4 protein n=1 Tax=Vibrio furnissii TaxID=29494 RepID=UPI0012AD8D6C|nr:glycosyltransferase family 4 protein [Vibrio furnissii]